MELIVVLVISALVIWWFVLRSSQKTSDTHPEAPYKVEPETTSPSEPVVENKVETRIDPVAIALDLEPVVINRRTHVLDVNKDGKVDLTDAKDAVKKTRTRVKKAADVDGDGKVTLKDAKAAVKKATNAKKTRSKKA